MLWNAIYFVLIHPDNRAQSDDQRKLSCKLELANGKVVSRFFTLEVRWRCSRSLQTGAMICYCKVLKIWAINL